MVDRTEEPEQDNPYIPCEVPKDHFDLTDFHRFSKKEFDFLAEYSKDLDGPRAAKEVGISPPTMGKWLEKEKFKQELTAIHDVWRKNIRMTSSHASAKLLDLMDKFEADYDMMEDGDKTKMAGALMKGVDSYLKATGKYQPEESGDGSNIVINVDLSGELSPRDIEGEVVEDVSS